MLTFALNSYKWCHFSPWPVCDTQTLSKRWVGCFFKSPLVSSAAWILEYIFIVKKKIAVFKASVPGLGPLLYLIVHNSFSRRFIENVRLGWEESVSHLWEGKGPSLSSKLAGSSERCLKWLVLDLHQLFSSGSLRMNVAETEEARVLGELSTVLCKLRMKDHERSD